MSHFLMNAVLPYDEVAEDGFQDPLEKRILKYRELGVNEDAEQHVPDDWIRHRIYDSDHEISPGVPHDRDGSTVVFESREDVERAGLAGHDELYSFNTHGRWDWYRIGGRWSPNFRLVQPRGVSEAVLGESGAFGRDENPNDDQADIAVKRDIDFSAMMEEAEERAREKAEAAKKVLDDIGGADPEPMQHFRDQGDTDPFWEQPSIRRIKHEVFDSPLVRSDTVYPLANDPDAYVETERRKAVAPFGFVHEDGSWEAKGEMGWFGASTDESEQEEWNERADEIIRSKPSDAVFVAVDFHV